MPKLEIPADEQQLGFSNTSMVIQDENEYTRLQRQLVGYERLRLSGMEIDDMMPQSQSQDSSTSTSASSSQSGSMATETDDSGYIHPQNQSNEYLELVFDEHAAYQTESSLYDEIPASLAEKEMNLESIPKKKNVMETWTM